MVLMVDVRRLVKTPWAGWHLGLVFLLRERQSVCVRMLWSSLVFGLISLQLLLFYTLLFSHVLITRSLCPIVRVAFPHLMLRLIGVLFAVRMWTSATWALLMASVLARGCLLILFVLLRLTLVVVASHA
jgi:hypothetical protein